jgi:hypothetical protein
VNGVARGKGRRRDNKKAAGESPTAKKDTHRPGLAPALGLRAGNDGFVIVPQTNL